MAIIGIRDLVRGSKDILERVEEGQEPFVITRHGQPVAALVPIAPEDAERYLLAAAPEMIESRKRAEAAGTKRGRPLEEVAREYGLEDEPKEAPRRLGGVTVTLDENVRVRAATNFESLLGRQLAETFAERATTCVNMVTAGALDGAREAGVVVANDDDLVRINELNATLFAAKARDVLVDTVRLRADELAHGIQVKGSPEGLIDESLVADALHVTAQYVDQLNQRIVAFAEQQPEPISLATYEVSLLTSIEALGHT